MLLCLELHYTSATASIGFSNGRPVEVWWYHEPYPFELEKVRDALEQGGFRVIVNQSQKTADDEHGRCYYSTLTQVKV